jgi:hypothetical protein
MIGTKDGQKMGNDGQIGVRCPLLMYRPMVGFNLPSIFAAFAMLFGY